MNNQEAIKAMHNLNMVLSITPSERESVNMAIAALEEQQRRRWVPVEERLPEKKGVYLVAYHPCYWDRVNNEICTGVDTFMGKSAWAKRKYQRIIAWQPLPKSYRPEKGDK